MKDVKNDSATKNDSKV